MCQLVLPIPNDLPWLRDFPEGLRLTFSRQPTDVRGQPRGSGAGARMSRPSRRREQPC
jgi:hypothetical protein